MNNGSRSQFHLQVRLQIDERINISMRIREITPFNRKLITEPCNVTILQIHCHHKSVVFRQREFIIIIFEFFMHLTFVLLVSTCLAKLFFKVIWNLVFINYKYKLCLAVIWNCSFWNFVHRPIKALI